MSGLGGCRWLAKTGRKRKGTMRETFLKRLRQARHNLQLLETRFTINDCLTRLQDSAPGSETMTTTICTRSLCSRTGPLQAFTRTLTGRQAMALSPLIFRMTVRTTLLRMCSGNSLREGSTARNSRRTLNERSLSNSKKGTWWKTLLTLLGSVRTSGYQELHPSGKNND